MTIKSKELAKLLGVSTATMSLVLNNKPGISAELREKLVAKINELGYGEMINNRNVTQATEYSRFTPPKHEKHNIAYAIYNYQADGGDNFSFFPSVLEGTEMQAREDGYNLQVMHLGKCRCSIKDCINKDDTLGMIVQLDFLTPQIKEELDSVGLPYILVDCYSYTQNVSSVCVNNEDGMHYAVKYLTEHGHKKIGYIASGKDTNSVLERRRCFHLALREYGIEDREDYKFFTGGTDDSQAYKSLYDQWSKTKDMPTALVAENDILAWRGMKALKKLGYNIPEDISVIGFDDRSVAALTDPALTTIRVHKHLLGREAVLLLENMIRMSESGFHGTPYKFNIGVRLIERESVTDAKK